MATKRKWIESAAAAPSPLEISPPASSYKPCPHLLDYKSKHGIHAFRALQKCLGSTGGPPCRASVIRRDDEEIPRCAACAKSSGRLYACLICASVACVAHARPHAQATPGHDLGIDLDRAELFCCICNDQVYDPDFDRVVLCASSSSSSPSSAAAAFSSKVSINNTNCHNNNNIEGSISSSNGGPLRSKPLNVYTRKKYRPWVPSAKDQLVIKQGATPLTNDACLPSGLRGLNNMGNTCFMNSVLQALLHTPPLRNYFLSDKHNKAVCQRKTSRRCLGCDMDDIFSAAFSGDRTPYSPAQFLYSWWQHAANLAGYEQQDAHEFFISTVEGIHASSSETSAQQQQPERQSNRSNDAECRCIVHRVFSGLLRSDVTCAACGFTSTTYDPCVDISLDLESAAVEKQQNSNGYVYTSSSTLLGCLDRFTRPEKLGSNERFLCESCQVRQEAIKQMSIRKLPLVLCFHVKRFEHSARNYRKLDRYVQFPFSLDMACYLSSSIVRFRHGNRLIFVDDESSSNSSSIGPSSEFELFAVVTHSGKLEGGHYVSYLRLAGHWYKCDDAWITRVSDSVVRATQAYMLYYVQKTLSYKSTAAVTAIADDHHQHHHHHRHQKSKKLDENSNNLGY